MDKTQIKNIYEKLQDDLSRKIFTNRLMYSYTGDLSFIANIVLLMPESKKLQNWLDNRKHKKIFVYGAGNMGRAMRLSFFANWAGFIDNNAKKNEIEGLSVISFDEFKKNHKDSCVVVGSYTYGKEMYENLLSAGVSDVFDIKAFHLPLEHNQYFDVPEFYPMENDIFVDVGAFDGFNTLNFARLADNKYRHIYCFEPNKDILPMLKNNLTNIERCTLIEKGTWNKSVSKSFDYNATGSKVIENFGGRANIIELDSLDNMLRENKVTFIKMDIEGSEGKTIIGAEKIIRNQKPKMAVCVYHKPEDIIELPTLLLEYNPDYRFYLRHYSLNESETVLYAF